MWCSKRTCYQVLVEYNVDSPTIRANAKKSKLLGHIMLPMSDNIIHPSAQLRICTTAWNCPRSSVLMI